MKVFPIYCGGDFLETSTKLEVHNPYSGKVVANTFLADKTELELALKAAQKVRIEMKTLPSYKRYAILMEIANEISLEREQLALLLCQESGKPFRYAIAEIDRAAQTFIVAAEEAKRLPKEFISLDWTKVGENKNGIINYFPIGIVAGIAPFNFPLNLAVHKIAPAIAAGCPIILKPASSTPLSTLALAKIIDKTELPKGAVSILPMNRSLGNLLVTDERIALLSFTGSPQVGWEMKKNAGRKKVILELGGNAGVIITKHADIEMTVKKCLVGAFAYSGQICIHVQRIFIAKEIFESFSKLFCLAASKLIFGDPTENTTDISSMIDEANAKRVESWVEEAVNAGAKVLLGGKRNGSFYPATVLTNTTNLMKVNCEEVFGPVVLLEPFDNFDEAIRFINDSKFGLQAGVFTNEISEMDQAFNEIETGGVILNDVPTFRMDHMPYGGIKESGLGREGVKYAMMDMLEPKILVK